MSEIKNTSITRRYENNRLAYYKDKADEDYWKKHWEKVTDSDFYENMAKGELGYFKDIFINHVPKEGVILEAGCGLGQIVLALRNKGYDCQGVEWSKDTIDMTLKRFPELPLHKGNVYDLDAPDSFYHGYISLGVVEHFYEGPEKIIQEARRVLDQDGVLLISVPNFHILRQLKSKLGIYGKGNHGKDFYQFAFKTSEFSDILSKCGFEVEKIYGYDPIKGIRDEWRFIEKIIKIPKLGWRIHRFIKKSATLQRIFGHMSMYVCKKSNSSSK